MAVMLLLMILLSGIHELQAYLLSSDSCLSHDFVEPQTRRGGFGGGGLKGVYDSMCARARVCVHMCEREGFVCTCMRGVCVCVCVCVSVCVCV